ncbi:ferredoxin reductase family protein [soil metagenome]
MSHRALLLSKVAYVILAGAPLAVAAIGHPGPGRGFIIEFGVGLGFVGFSMLALQFALTAKFRWISTVLGLDTLLHFHRQIGLIAYGFIVAHLGILMASRTEYLNFLNLWDEPIRALALWAVLTALTLIIVSTLWRRQMRIPYDWWRRGHGVLALMIVFIGLVHILRVGWYISQPWKQLLWIIMTMAAVGLLLYARVYKPMRLKQRPWRVAEVRRERGQSWTLRFVPDGHDGMPFLAGQFVWLTLGSSPYSIHQHPFSISSSAAHPRAIDLTVKELGDYTESIGQVEVGTPAFLDGPYGSFILDDEAKGAVFIAGGIGITPVMSILRTMRDRSERFPATLIYGVGSEEGATFLEELNEMASEPWLDLVLIVDRPSAKWQGERGFLNQDILNRSLPKDRPGLRYFVCGPEPMMDMAEAHLHDSGVPTSRINSERFNLA